MTPRNQEKDTKKTTEINQEDKRRTPRTKKMKELRNAMERSFFPEF